MVGAARLRNGTQRRILVDMAAARTVLQFLDGVIHGRGVDFLVLAGFELTGVAAGAIRPVSGILPGNDFIVGGVAADAEHTGLVRTVGR